MTVTSAAASDARPRRRAHRAPVGPLALVRALAAAVRLTVDLLRDVRVPAAGKLTAAAAALYLIWPVDLIADVLPVVGQLDDVALLLWSWRRLLQAAGADIIGQVWRGDERSLDLALTFAGVD